MTNEEVLLLIIGVLLPPIIEIVKQKRFEGWINGLIVIATCLVIALATIWARGTPISVENYAQAAIIITVAAIAAYRLYWQPVLGDKLMIATSILK